MRQTLRNLALKCIFINVIYFHDLFCFSVLLCAGWRKKYFKRSFHVYTQARFACSAQSALVYMATVAVTCCEPLSNKSLYCVMMLLIKVAKDFLPKVSHCPCFYFSLWRVMAQNVGIVLQQDMPGKGKHAENKDHCVTCQSHAPKGHGEWCWGLHVKTQMDYHQGPWIACWFHYRERRGLCV